MARRLMADGLGAKIRRALSCQGRKISREHDREKSIVRKPLACIRRASYRKRSSVVCPSSSDLSHTLPSVKVDNHSGAHIEDHRHSIFWFDDRSCEVKVGHCWFGLHTSIVKMASPYFQAVLDAHEFSHGFRDRVYITLTTEPYIFQLFCHLLYPSTSDMPMLMQTPWSTFDALVAFAEAHQAMRVIEDFSMIYLQSRASLEPIDTLIRCHGHKLLALPAARIAYASLLGQPPNARWQELPPEIFVTVLEAHRQRATS